VESIKALLIWAKDRGYLESNPLEGIAPFDATAEEPRGALTAEQLTRLIAVAPPERSIIYEVAACTEYRKGELSALKVRDLDEISCTLPLVERPPSIILHVIGGLLATCL
jgi:integrase